MNLRRVWLVLAVLGALWGFLGMCRGDWAGSFASSCAGATFYWLSSRDDDFL